MTQSKALPRCATIAPQYPFLPTLVEALLDGRLVPGFHCNRAVLESNPFALSDVTLFLPTRRAVRAIEVIFVEAITKLYDNHVSAALLPKIRAMGDIDGADLLLQETNFESVALITALAPEIGELERHVILSEMVWSWSRALLHKVTDLPHDEAVIIPANPSDAALLAKDLAKLLDEAENIGINWENLHNIVPDELTQYWQLSRSFLEIVTQHWPQYLADNNRMDSIARRNLLLRTEAAAFKAQNHRTGPVIAAGSTGSVPATAELLQAIAHLPKGCVVFPGLDLDLDDKAWEAIRASKGSIHHAGIYGHPQFILKRTLERIGLARAQVFPLMPKRASPKEIQTGKARQRLINEALRPAQVTDSWSQILYQLEHSTLATALENLHLVEARHAQEEALSIALILRAALDNTQDDHKPIQVALITPDRQLALRVRSELQRFGIEIDDSAGTPLFSTPCGILAKLCIETVANGFSAIPLLGLLKHPLASFGIDRAQALHNARTLEQAALRGPALQPGSQPLLDKMQGICHALENKNLKTSRLNSAQQMLEQSDGQQALDMAARIQQTLRPLETLFAHSQALFPLAQFVDTHLSVLHEITKGPDTERKWTDSDDGETLRQAMERLSAFSSSKRSFKIRPMDYSKLLQALIGESIIRKPINTDPRIHIFGTLEARLLHMDTVVLAGLNEKTWPAETRLDPWLSRSMRASLGLPPPELSLGLSAHDFAQYSVKPQVFLTRCEREATTPTQPSRWLLRLKALIGVSACNQLLKRGHDYLELARGLDAPDCPTGHPVKRPNPCPELSLRPQQLSVTEIETLIRDPYAIYAKHILKLKPLDPISELPGPAQRGNLIHEILHQFFSQNPDIFHHINAEQNLYAIAEQVFEPLKYLPSFYAYWKARFKHIAKWLLLHEVARHNQIAKRFMERPGRLEFKNPAFCLTARADRIDLLKNGQAELIDYKTGMTRSKKQVEAHLAPQLTLEAAILSAGGFDGLPALLCERLSYIKLSGNQPPGDYQVVASGVDNISQLTQAACDKLRALISYYAQPKTGYLSQAQPQFINYTGPYDPLARVAEWQGIGNAQD